MLQQVAARVKEHLVAQPKAVQALPILTEPLLPLVPEHVRVAVVGDVMLGRLIDQMLPIHVEDKEDAPTAKSFLKFLGMKTISGEYIWGSTADHFKAAHCRLINLETSVTTHSKKWPDKTFNYRMHPHNIETLRLIDVNYCSLANNHTLDFGHDGMRETQKTLREASINFAGVGENLDEALRPAIFTFSGPGETQKKMACFSIADHPDDWAATSSSPGIAYVNVEHQKKEEVEMLEEQIKKVRQAEQDKGAPIDWVCLSIHWGSNYQWSPLKEFQRFAKRMIDSGVDIIHGHSSHHFQGIEIYKGKPILYGCGDFIDDYAVDKTFRNDLGFLYELIYDPKTNDLRRVEMIPTQIRKFKVRPSHRPQDRDWQFETMSLLCKKFGTTLNRAPEAAGQPEKFYIIVE